MYSKQPVRVDNLYCVRETDTAYEVSTIKFSTNVDAKVLKSLVSDSDLTVDKIGFVVIPLWLAEAMGFKYEKLDDKNGINNQDSDLYPT